MPSSKTLGLQGRSRHVVLDTPTLLIAALQAVLQKEVPAEQVQQLLDMLLQRDLQPLLQQQVQLGGPGQQFVVGRALALGGKLCEVATHQQKELFLRAAAAAGAC